MNFRKLEVTGFKSFADKVELIFEPGITAVVGPNGCGKSNISDAIKWALGEQSAKAIRCEKMDDIIFNGGSTRRALGMAQVSLIMSNPNKILPTDYAEVELERRLFRSGESEYYLNRNRCLLKDIQELFMDTGLGVNSYSIMEQGHIDLILNSNPQDRRLILEEAAGITKFRHRKRAAIKKLEATEQNLLRINDIIYELEQQVASLKRQESRARTYQRYYAELKNLDTVLNRRKYHEMIANLKSIQDSLTGSDDRMNSISASTIKLEAEMEAHRLTITEFEGKLADIRTQERRLQGRIEETESDIAVLRERRTNLQQQQQRVSTEIARMTERIQNLEKQIASMSAERDSLNEIISNQENELRIAQESANALTSSTAVVEKNAEELKAQVIESLNKKARIQNELTATDSRLDYLANRLERLNTNAENFRAEKQQLEESLDKLNEDIGAKEEEISDMMARQNQVNSQSDQLKSKLALLEKSIRETEQKRGARSSRLQSLQELQIAYEGYGAGVKAILGQKTKKGICGVIAEIIRTEPQYELAIEACLGSNLQCIVTETLEDARAAVEYLRERKIGRATFLPVDMINEKIRSDNEKPAQLELTGFRLIPASRIVESDAKYSSVVQYFLDNTVIVEDLDTAVQLALANHVLTLTFATLDGQVVSSTGAITGGAGSEGAGLLRRSREINELKKEVAEIDEQLNGIYKERDEIVAKISAFQQEKDRIAKNIQTGQISYTGLQKDISQYKQRLARLVSELSVVESEYSTLDKEIAALKEKKTKLAADVLEFDEKSNELNKSIEKLQTEMRTKIQQRDAVIQKCTDLRIQLASKTQQEKGLTENLKSLEQEIAQLIKTQSSYQTSASSDGEVEKDITEKISVQEKALEDLFADRSKIESETSSLESQRQGVYNELTQGETLVKDYRRELDQLKQERYQLEVAKTQVQMNMDALVSKMQERYGIPLADLQTEVEVSEAQGTEISDDEISTRIEELRTRMDRLGTVNLTAVDEYNRQKDRYDLMIMQRDDLLKAKESLYSIIQRINKESRERLKETFDSVNINFQNFFQRLFGGGHGELVLLGEGDVLESGVEIIARPPGKKPQAISMLSTGERSLTAIALMFALFSIKPSPFCVMDEVDAALDDANVGRFTDMVKEFSRDIQFVIITHNKRTMEKANVLYGITMEESGVSKLVSLRMNGGK